MGFSYGNSLSNGDDMATSFLWMKAGANHPLPYSEVYLRLPPCAADPCNSHGTCSVGANGPICMCDPPYSGETCAIVGAADGTSCLDILTRFPASPSGTHGIDPDGNGPLPTFSAFCDMTTNGGGWTTIGNDTFESGSATGWSSGSVDSSCPTAFTKFLGGATQFAMGSSTQRVFDLMQMPHTEALISLDFIVLDSWDGEQAIVSVDSTELYNMSFSHGGGGDVCGAGFNDLGLQPVSSQLAHTGNSLTLQVTSTLDQDPSDESWAIDNVRVMIR
ncbi:MAG TPA: fibrinogen-like YCDxxxxGGGW domain-containing protein [Polyangiales bacterium]|nr:fibrinogen-like YCDxxxxGGGW domain-containing protein [Polyangiales bacterium]